MAMLSRGGRQECLTDMWNHQDHEELRKIRKALERLVDIFEPRLTSIEIKFDPQEDSMSAAAVTLNIGQTTVASVVGFDQFGNPFTPVPQPSWAIDNPGIASIVPDATTPASEDVTGVATGTANLTAGLTTAEGLALTATGVVTVSAAAKPVLSSIQIQFASPATPAAAAKK